MITENLTAGQRRAVRNAFRIQRRKAVIELAGASGNVSKTCRKMKMPRSTFYRWKARYDKEGASGLANRPSGTKGHPWSTPPDVIEKIVHLRKTYQLGPQRITWYLERYHGITVSCSTVYRTLIRQGLRRLPRNATRRALHTRRYSKRVPGHHLQVDVKFLNLAKEGGGRVRRCQYTAIDDATRIRALKIYRRHTQKNAIDFIDHVVERFPSRIHTIRTDRGHEFQALFHWHVEDQGMRHVYIKPRTPQLNGKVERSHRTDQEEFYQLLTFTDEVNLNAKLSEWERFYNFDRPYGAFGGRAPYEALRDLIK
jgi:transposase InsO family protein